MLVSTQAQYNQAAIGLFGFRRVKPQRLRAAVVKALMTHAVHVATWTPTPTIQQVYHMALAPKSAHSTSNKELIICPALLTVANVVSSIDLTSLMITHKPILPRRVLIGVLPAPL